MQFSKFFSDNLIIINGGWLILICLLLFIAKKHYQKILFFDLIRRVFFLLVLLLFYSKFTPKNYSQWQFNIHLGNEPPFLPFFGLNFGLNYWGYWLSILLTILNFINIILGRYDSEKKSVYYLLLTMIELGSFGVLCSKEPLWFFIFFEFSILPLFFLINFYGYENRQVAAYRYLIYTSISGVMILLLVFFGLTHLDSKSIYSTNTASGIEHFVQSINNLDIYSKSLYYILLVVAFGIKIPLIGFHFWLPYAHTEAPTAGSVLLAGIILKLGLYGYYLFGGTIFSPLLSTIPLIFCALNLIYGTSVVFYEIDLKRFIAYSSISHMGVAFAAVNIPGYSKVALFYAVSHGLSTCGLFFLAGFLLENNHARQIQFYKGLAKVSPFFSILFFLFSLISMGFPGFSGFIGELYTLLGTFKKGNIYLTISLAIFIFLNTWLTINLVSRIIFSTPQNNELKFNNIEKLIWITPLIIFSLLLGLKPKILL
jgi:NADH-quinone oxidoreductase subunit M